MSTKKNMIQKIAEMGMDNKSSKQNTKLRDLIKNIRACKTAAEERALVFNEKAAIRESFSKNEAEYRPRNVAKLLFIHMLGHNTDFGQMECLNLITANSFTEKRIGYLGLTQLFHEKAEVLMMATNRVHHDLNSSSNYVISLALIALSEICTTEMCNTLLKNVLKVMSSGTSFVKKKAALACTKIVKRIPEATDQVIEKIDKLMEDRHHGVLLSTLGLVEEIIIQDPKHKDHFKKFFTPMIRVMKGLVSTYSQEFDVSGISDPYLQIKILEFFKLMAVGNAALSEEVSETLANVASTTASNKNTGNAVLFECVKTIFAIESTTTLKTLGINILGKFLTHKDANSKYCSLYMLKQVLNHDINAVAKHKNMIMDCLRENDSSIKQLALDLTYLISNESNAKGIVKELLNYLLSVNDPEFLKELTSHICLICDKHSPTKRWYVDTVTKVLTLAGNYVKEDSISLFIHLICQTPDLQTYALHKLYFALQENTNQQGLAKATIYILGEYGTLLTSGQCVGEDNQAITVTEAEIVQLIQKVFSRVNMDSTIKEYGLTCLMKLYTKFQTQRAQIVQMLNEQQTSTHHEVQKRACEYVRLIQPDWDESRNQICEQIPEYEGAAETFSNKPVSEMNTQKQDNQQAAGNAKPEKEQDLIGFDDILSGGPTNQNNGNQNNKAPDAGNDLLDVFGDMPVQNNQQNTNNVNNNAGGGLDDLMFGGNNNNAPQQVSNANVQQNNQNNGGGIDLMDDLLGMPSQPPVQVQPQPVVQQSFPVQPQVTQPQQEQQQISGFSDSNLEILFSCVKNGNVIKITTLFNNKTSQLLQGVVFKVAVQKHLTLDFGSMNSGEVLPNSQGQTKQEMTITNNKQGEKGVVLKLMIEYTVNQQKQSQQVVVNNFPQGW